MNRLKYKHLVALILVACVITNALM